MIPDTGRLSIPVDDHREGDGYIMISATKCGTRYCLRADIAKELIKEGWHKVPELDELPF